MDVIAIARELGAALQKDERYLKLAAAQKANEEDTALNELISKLQLVQLSFQQEASKEDKDDAKLQEMDAEFSQLYAQVMANPNMQAYQNAAQEVDKLMKYVNGIFTLCLQGQDPATCEPEEEHHCSGECSSCGGCH